MSVSERDELFSIICEASDRQVDPIVKRRLESYIGKPHEEIKDLLLDLLDDIAYRSLTSNFEIMALDCSMVTNWRN
jgi:hypothetical protein